MTKEDVVNNKLQQAADALTTRASGTGFPFTITLSDDRMRDVLVGAFEGGSNYWLDRVEVRLRDGLTSRSPELRLPKGWAGNDSATYGGLYSAPFVRGCYLECYLDEPLSVGGLPESKGPYRLDRAAMQRGIDLLAAGCTPEEIKESGNDWKRRHLFDMIREEDDATTADVILQACLFGEVIFG